MNITGVSLPYSLDELQVNRPEYLRSMSVFHMFPAQVYISLVGTDGFHLFWSIQLADLDHPPVRIRTRLCSETNTIRIEDDPDKRHQ